MRAGLWAGLVTVFPELIVALSARALERQVVFVVGSAFHVNGTGHGTIRLSFSEPAPERIDEGIREYQQIVDGPYKPNQIRVAKIHIASALIKKQQYGEARGILQPLQDSNPKDEWVAALLRDIDNMQKF